MKVETIFLTGYKDFIYAKEAIKYKAKGYLNKPVDEQELIEVLNDIRAEIMNNEMYEEGISALKEKFLRNLLISQNEYDNLFSHIYEYNTGLDENGAYNVILAETDMEDFPGSGQARINDCSVRDKIKSIIEGVINNYYMGYVLDNDNTQFCIIIHDEKMVISNENIKKIVEEIKKEIMSYTGNTMTFSVGKNVWGISNLYLSYSEAIKSLTNSFILGNDRIVFSGSHTSGSNVYDMEIRHYIDEVLKSIDDFDYDKICQGVVRIFDGIRSEVISEKIVKDIIMEIIVQINKVIREMYGDISQVLGGKFDLFEKLNKKFTINELEDWIKSIVSSYCLYIYKLKNDKPNELVDKIKDYINKNYGMDLSLKIISKEFFVNTSYLGQLFKKEMGDSFNDYLSKLRVENAKRFLKTTDMKVYEISEKVGFKDVQYFYKTYKKITGMHPTSLRFK